MIPKIFHHIWLGDDPFPAQFQEWRDMTLSLHPGWESRLWTENNRPPLRLQRLYDVARTPSEKADIMRFELLSTYGGVYLDTDHLCVRNIESLLCDAAMVVAFETEDFVATSFIASVPEHPVVGAMMAKLASTWESTANGMPHLRGGPMIFTPVVRDWMAYTLIYDEWVCGNFEFLRMLPREAMSPVTYEERERLQGKSIETLMTEYPEAHGFHFYDASWKRVLGD